MATPVVNVPGVNLGGEQTIESIPRRVRRDPAFRAEIERLRRGGATITADTPFTFGSKSNEAISALSSGSVGPSPSSVGGFGPSFIQTPGGTFRREGNGFVFDENPQIAARKQRRNALLQQFELQLAQGIGPERVQQIRERAKGFGDRLFKQSETLLRQVELGRGRDGSPLDDATINLASETSQRAELLVEQLFASDRQATLSGIQALNQGLSGDTAQSLQAQQLAAGIRAGDVNASTSLANANTAQVGANGRLGAQLAFNQNVIDTQLTNQRQSQAIAARNAKGKGAGSVLAGNILGGIGVGQKLKGGSGGKGGGSTGNIVGGAIQGFITGGPAGAAIGAGAGAFSGGGGNIGQGVFAPQPFTGPINGPILQGIPI